MSEQRETREMQYQLSRKLLDLMLKNGFLEPEEYAKIDTLNRSTFSPELEEVYAKNHWISEKRCGIVLC